MLVEPAEPEFSRRYGEGEAQVIWTRLIADLETPVSAMLKLSSGRHNCFLLESVEGGAVRELRMVPVRLELAVVNRARGDDLEDVVARMKALCAELGTRPEWDPEVGALVLRPGDDAGRRPASHRPALRDTSSS